MWPCDLCIGKQCSDPKCEGGRRCQAALCSPPLDECEHEEFDHDILTGRATCARCGESWYLSYEEAATLSTLQGMWDGEMAKIEAPSPIQSTREVSEDDLPF